MDAHLSTTNAPHDAAVFGRTWRRHAWRLLRPSLADALFVLFLLQILLLGTNKFFNDPGTGWHLRTGEYVLRNHAAPTVDVFSYTRAGEPWVATQWLADAVMAGIFQLGGFSLLALATAALLAMIFRWIYRTHVRAGGWPAIAILVALVGAAAASGHFLARPLLVTSLLLPVCFWLSTEYCRGRIRGRLLLLLPIFTVLWANLHPGVLGGIATIVVCSAGCALDRLIQAPRGHRLGAMRRPAVLFVVASAMAAATLVNPYGIGWHRWIRNLMQLDMSAHVTEWMPPAWNEQEFVAALCLLVCVLIAAVLRRDRIRWAEIGVIGFWTWQAFSSARHVPLLGMICALQLARLLADLPLDATLSKKLPLLAALFSDDIRKAERGPSSGLISIAAVAALSAWFLLGHGRLPSVLAQAGPSADRYSYEAVQYIRSHPPDGPLLNDLNYGGMLIHFAPNVPVMADDRFGLYGQEFLDQYMSAILTPEQGGLPLLDARQPACVLMNSAFPFATWLQHQPEWVVAFEDDLAVVLVRKSPEAESEE